MEVTYSIANEAWPKHSQENWLAKIGTICGKPGNNCAIRRKEVNTIKEGGGHSTWVSSRGGRPGGDGGHHQRWMTRSDVRTMGARGQGKPGRKEMRPCRTSLKRGKKFKNRKNV